MGMSLEGKKKTPAYVPPKINCTIPVKNRKKSVNGITFATLEGHVLIILHELAGCFGRSSHITQLLTYNEP